MLTVIDFGKQVSIYRFELFAKARTLIDSFDTLDMDSKFIEIMSCEDIQTSLSYAIFKSFQRRKLFST